jgi:putative membrane protein
MFVRWLFAALHLLGLGIGLGAIWGRARALAGPLDARGIRRALQADTWWGIAALVWISTGLVRAFAGLEKGTSYYLHNHFFLGKMGLLLLILLLEVAPMKTLRGWRITRSKGEDPDTTVARRLARTSFVQAGLVILMVVLATGMARGLGTPHP